jgi:glycosyltransferase involved in cell wall biosynthesis
MDISGINIGFVSTRFAGTDGVSLEANKWADVLQKAGHQCFWFAGELDKDKAVSFLAPEAHFKFERNQWINRRIFGVDKRQREVTEAIHTLRSLLKIKLERFIDFFHIDLLVIENALSIPLNIPFGLAITEIISETGIATIAHHHDFCWERPRFAKNAVEEYLQMAFPPVSANIQNVVINSNAQKELAHRRGISSEIIPNVLEFEKPPLIDAVRKSENRALIGIRKDDIVILQPTRIIKRKGIEMAVDMVKALKNPRCRLIISHDGNDEGLQYVDWLTEYAQGCSVDLSVVSSSVRSPWATQVKGREQLSLWDIYPVADFITLPSRNEGFGNALLEAIYFKKPILVNRYPIYIQDIEPLGFDLISVDGYMDRRAVQSVQNLLVSPERRNQMTAHNFRIAARHYSYSVLQRKLNHILEALLPAKDAGLNRENTYPDCPLRLVDVAI